MISDLISSFNSKQLVAEQRKLSHDFITVQQKLSKVASGAEKDKILVDSGAIEQQLKVLEGKLNDLGVNVYTTTDILREFNLKRKRAEEDATKEEKDQAKAELAALSKKKSSAALSLRIKNLDWETFQMRYWGLTGRAVKWVTALSGGSLIAKGLTGFYRIGVEAQEVQLSTTGALAGNLSAWAGDTVNYISTAKVIEGTLKAYGSKTGNTVELTRRFVALAGADRVRAEETFSKLASVARISNKSVKDLWGIAESRVRNYRMDLDSAVDEVTSLVEVADGTSKLVEEANAKDGVVQKTGKILRQDFLQGILSVTDEIESSGKVANQIEIAKAFSAGVAAGNKLRASMSDTLSLAKSYTKFLHLDEVYNWQLGYEVLREIESEVTKRMYGLAASERDRVVHDVVLNKFGSKFAASAEVMYKTAINGQGHILAASDIGELYSQTMEGSKRALAVNYDLVKYGADTTGVQLLTQAGMKREEAMLAVIAIKSGNMTILSDEQKAILTGQGYRDATSATKEARQGLILAGAKSVFGDVTGKLAELTGNPLVQLGAGIGIAAVGFRREIADGFSLTRRWSSLVKSYLGWAGKTGLDKLSSLMPGAGGPGKLAKVGKFAKYAALASLGGLGAAYGVNKLLDSSDETKPEDSATDQKTQVEGNTTPTNTAVLFGYDSLAKTAEQAVNPEPVRLKMASAAEPTAALSGIADNMVREEVVNRDFAARKSAIAAVGGNLVRSPSGAETAEIRVPGFIASMLPARS